MAHGSKLLTEMTDRSREVFRRVVEGYLETGDGFVILTNGERIEVDAISIPSVVDTTGAGDLYAAGFLYGYTAGRSLADCGRLGSLAAGLVIQQVGPRPLQSLAAEAKKVGLI